MLRQLRVRSRTGTRTAVQSTCNNGTPPSGRTGMGNGQKKHRGTEEVNMTTRTPRDAHGVPDEWLTVDEVCTELKISRRTFDRWRALGTGPPMQAPRRDRLHPRAAQLARRMAGRS